MNFKQILPYKLRRALTIGAIAGGTLVACDKNANEPQEPIIPTFDKVLYIGTDFRTPKKDTIQKYLNTPNISHIYIVPQGDFTICSEGKIIFGCNELRGMFKYFNNTTKISGNGIDGFQFTKGRVTPDDSTFFAQHGWPVSTKQQ